jgi:outer membrane protein TolC
MKKHLFSYKAAVILLSIFASYSAKAQQADTLTLDKAIEVALKNNNLLHIKQLQAAEHQAGTREAVIKYFPVFTLNSTYQYNVNTGQLTIPAGSFGVLPLGAINIPMPPADKAFELGKHHTFNAGVVVYQPITQLGKIKIGVDIAKTDYSIASLEQSKAALQITNAVEQLYYGILAVRKRKEEAQKNIEVAKLILFDVQGALQSGKAIEANEAGLNANIADKEQALLKLKFEEEDYLAEFKTLTGIIADELLLADDHTGVSLDKGLEAYQTDAGKNNMDIQLTRFRKQKSELGIQAARHSYLPEIGIMGGYTYQEGNILYPRHNPFIGARFQWNIQDLFSNRQVLNQRKLLQRQAEENEAYTRKQTSVAVEKAYRKMRQAEELIAVAEKAVNYRRQELKVAYDKRAAGLNTPINVMETEAAMAKAEADLYAAKQSHKVAVAELRMLTAAR